MVGVNVDADDGSDGAVDVIMKNGTIEGDIDGRIVCGACVGSNVGDVGYRLGVSVGDDKVGDNVDADGAFVGSIVGDVGNKLGVCVGADDGRDGAIVGRWYGAHIHVISDEVQLAFARMQENCELSPQYIIPPFSVLHAGSFLFTISIKSSHPYVAYIICPMGP